MMKSSLFILLFSFALTSAYNFGNFTQTSGPAGGHLSYYGGPTLPSPSIFFVNYGNRVSAQVRNSMISFFNAIGQTSWSAIVTEYYQIVNGQTIYITDDITFAETFTLAEGPSVIDDTALQAMLSSYLQANSNLYKPSGLYFIFTPPGVTVTQGGGASCQEFCAYHGCIQSPLGVIYYALVPDFSPGSGCDFGCGSLTMLQNLWVVSSHELAETITDAQVGFATSLASPLAWYDAVNGEIGDLCNGISTPVAGNNGRSYFAQQLWSNRAGSCVGSEQITRPPVVIPATSAPPAAATPCQQGSDCFSFSDNPNYVHCVGGVCKCAPSFSGTATPGDNCRCDGGFIAYDANGAAHCLQNGQCLNGQAWMCASVSTDITFVDCLNGQCVCKRGFAGSATVNDKCSCAGSILWEPTCSV